MIFSIEHLHAGCGLLIYLTAYTILCTIYLLMIGISVYLKRISGSSIPVEWCGLITGMDMVTCYASHWIDLCIVANRVMAVCFPHSHRVFSTKKVVKFTVVCVWITAFHIATPGWFGLGVQYVVTPLGNCYTQQNGFLGLLTLVIGIFFSISFRRILLCGGLYEASSWEMPASISSDGQCKCEKKPNNETTGYNSKYVVCVVCLEFILCSLAAGCWDC